MYLLVNKNFNIEAHYINLETNRIEVMEVIIQLDEECSYYSYSCEIIYDYVEINLITKNKDTLLSKIDIVTTMKDSSLLVDSVNRINRIATEEIFSFGEIKDQYVCVEIYYQAMLTSTMQLYILAFQDGELKGACTIDSNINQDYQKEGFDYRYPNVVKICHGHDM